MSAQLLVCCARGATTRGDTWAGGLCWSFFDGRHVYVESRDDGPDWGTPSVSVEAMPPTSDLPKLPLRHDSTLYGWIEELPELGDYLRRSS